MSRVSSSLSGLAKEMLSLKKSGIDPKKYEQTKIRLRVSLEGLAKEQRTEKENRLFENLLLGITRIGLLGEDQLSMLWDIEKVASNANHPVGIDEVKKIAVNNMFNDIALNFVCRKEHRDAVVPRCAAVKSRYIKTVYALEKYKDIEGIRNVARKARFEVVDILYKYDWHAQEAVTLPMTQKTA